MPAEVLLLNLQETLTYTNSPGPCPFPPSRLLISAYYNVIITPQHLRPPAPWPWLAKAEAQQPPHRADFCVSLGQAGSCHQLPPGEDVCMNVCERISSSPHPSRLHQPPCPPPSRAQRRTSRIPSGGRLAGGLSSHSHTTSLSFSKPHVPQGARAREGAGGGLWGQQAAAPAFPFPASICQEICFSPFERE